MMLSSNLTRTKKISDKRKNKTLRNKEIKKVIKDFLWTGYPLM